MESISLSAVLKSFLLKEPKYDPFADDFDGLSFIRDFRTFVERDNTNDFFVNDSGELIAIIQLNEIYENIMQSIEDLLDTLNLSAIQIIGHVLTLSNFETISISDEVVKHFKEDSHNVPQDFKESYNKTLKNVWGG